MAHTFLYVIVPIYNVEKYISRCLESLHLQVYPNCKFILIDDGSTDNSGAIAEDFATRDHRFHVIHSDNKGVSAARNKGINYAKEHIDTFDLGGGHGIDSQYITFVDPDDWLISADTLLKLAGEINSCGSDLIYFRNEYRNDECIIATAPALQEKMLKHEDIVSTFIPSVIFARKYDGVEIGASLWRGAFNSTIIFRHEVRFQEHLWKGEDWVFYSDFLKHCQTVKICNELFYVYYKRQDSTMNAYRRLPLSGIDKSLFILQRIKKNAIKCGVNIDFLNRYYSLRYTQSFLSYIYNIWDKRNKESFLAKYQRTNDLINNKSLRDEIKLNSHSSSSFRSKLEYSLVTHPNVLLLALWGVIYHLIRNLNNR